MSSPPYQAATSPPSLPSLALPRQRPTLALPTNLQHRKPSVTSATSSNHPLRQTSFPPPESLEAQHKQAEDNELSRYSPDADDNGSIESDEDITSAISGPVPEDAFSRKRKRGEPRRARGRPPKNSSLRRGSVSIANGDDTRSTKRGGGHAGASTVGGDDGDDGEDDDDDDDEGGTDLRAGASVMDAAELEQENKRRYLFREAVPSTHQNRYDAYNKVKLRTSDVRRLVNATLSQSVPQNVVTVVGAYTKMFAGILIESAREVQTEWMAAAKELPDGTENAALKKLAMMRSDAEEQEGKEKDTGRGKEPEARTEEKPDKHQDGNKHGGMPEVKIEIEDEEQQEGSREEGQSSQTNGKVNGHSDAEAKESTTEADEIDYVQPGAWGVIKEVDESARGPLLPDHIREALRRYKKSRAGGSVGFTGLSLEGRDVAAPRMGGRRLFK